MSDTVKLIIEIPKSALDLLNTTGVDWLDAEHILSTIAHGIPLDDVKTEIFDKAIIDANGEGFIFLGRLLRIFDNIGKPESEEI